MPKRRTSEKGQATVFLVISIIGLLGFAALALDGGMVYSDRRHAQNAADAAALAGGGGAGLILDQVMYDTFSCGSSDVAMASNVAFGQAVNQASNNGYTLTIASGTEPGENQIATDCEIIDHGDYEEKYVDVKVKIAKDVQTSLIHFVYSGPVRNVVESTVRVYPHKPLAFGHAIVALGPTCDGNDGGVIFDGGGGADINIFGGGIFSNACMEANGTALDICVDEETGASSCDGDGVIVHTTGYKESGDPSVDPEPQPSSGILPDFPYPEITCDGLVNRGSHSGAGSINPGIYSQIRLSTGDLHLDPGLYCLDGDFTVTGGVLSGNGVTIYLRSGDYSTAGNANVNLKAPKGTSNDNCDPAVCPPALPGLLFYMDASNPGIITLQGDSDSAYLGTVFAPTGEIDVGGGSSMIPTMNTQLIGERVNVHGNVTINVNFRGSEVYNLPSTLDVNR